MNTGTCYSRANHSILIGPGRKRSGKAELHGSSEMKRPTVVRRLWTAPDGNVTKHARVRQRRTPGLRLLAYFRELTYTTALKQGDWDSEVAGLGVMLDATGTVKPYALRICAAIKGQELLPLQKTQSPSAPTVAPEVTQQAPPLFSTLLTASCRIRCPLEVDL